MAPTKKPPNRLPRARPASSDDVDVFESLLKHSADRKNYKLRLYITGSTPRSAQAIANIRSLCDEYLSGRYDLEVVDIYQQPAVAAREQIIAAPTLIKHLPLPLKRLIGDLSNRDKVLIGLDLAEAPGQVEGGMNWIKM